MGSRKQAKAEIKQLKGQLQTTNRATDFRLLKLALLMLTLAVIAAFIYGRIHL